MHWHISATTCAMKLLHTFKKAYQDLPHKCLVMLYFWIAELRQIAMMSWGSTLFCSGKCPKKKGNNSSRGMMWKMWASVSNISESEYSGNYTEVCHCFGEPHHIASHEDFHCCDVHLSECSYPLSKNASFSTTPALISQLLNFSHKTHLGRLYQILQYESAS